MIRPSGNNKQPVRRSVTPGMFGLQNATQPVQRKQRAKRLTTP
jgi:hypothetical protein